MSKYIESPDAEGSVIFSATPAERLTIRAIAERANAMWKKTGSPYQKLDAEMDVEACHCNGFPLDLAKLLHADDFNFAHDMGGIRKHLNRQTGKLENYFLPRFAKK